MKPSYRVRFAGSSKYPPPPAVGPGEGGGDPAPPSGSSSALDSNRATPRRSKSRLGCKECKLRRVKCDETYPVCLRCQRRGSVCLSSSRPPQWQTEMPWLPSLSSSSPPLNAWGGGAGATPNKRLLQHWFEQTSQMMALDRNDNPLSFPLIRHLAASPSLLHAVQSVSAGHEAFFSGGANIETCLRERGRALRLVREELQDDSSASLPSFLAVFLLGVSAPWMEPRPDSYGEEHLKGARAVMKVILSDGRMREDPLAHFLMGWYLHWDMVCAFFADPEDPSNLDAHEVFGALRQGSDGFHPMTGFSSELYALVASVGRYCRRVLDRSVRDMELEETLEQALLAWTPHKDHRYLSNLSTAYRNHGLLMLYNACDGAEQLSRPADPQVDGLTESAVIPRDVVQAYAAQSLQMMLDTPTSEPSVVYHSLPLLSAAAELTSEHTTLRQEVIERYRALYSRSRVLVHIWSIELLEELWALRDAGVMVSWMELCLSKSCVLCFS